MTNDEGWDQIHSAAEAKEDTRNFEELLAALKGVQKIISEGAMTGFNCHDGDWAGRLFHSQQATSAAIKKATAVTSQDRGTQ